jgi:hypothetical protein
MQVVHLAVTVTMANINQKIANFLLTQRGEVGKSGA